MQQQSPLQMMAQNKKININVNMQMFKNGLIATFTREVPGFDIYFSVYEYIKAEIANKYYRNMYSYESFIAGGLSGITAWMFIYPQDRIKTILQSGELYNGNGNKNTYFTIAKNIYNSGGLKVFYSGFSWAIKRALLLHGGTFCMMELLTSIKFINICVS